MDDEFFGWMCHCGHWQNNDYHCSLCGREPPWGCDCGMHDEHDDWEDEPFLTEEELDAFYDEQAEAWNRVDLPRDGS